MRIRKSPARGRAETKLYRTLIDSYQREAFETLCKEGCDREWLAALVLWLRQDRPFKTRRIYVNRKECRDPGKTFARLARECDDLRKQWWRWRMPYKAAVMASYEEPLRFVRKLPPSYSKAQEPRRPVEFDVDILCEQLRAAADHFGRLGKEQTRVACLLQVEDFNLRRLLSYVKEQTGTAHNNEVSILCEAVTGRHSVEALKQRAYRSRGGQRPRRSAGPRQTTRGQS